MPPPPYTTPVGINNPQDFIITPLNILNKIFYPKEKLFNPPNIFLEIFPRGKIPAHSATYSPMYGIWLCWRSQLVKNCVTVYFGIKRNKKYQDSLFLLSNRLLSSTFLESLVRCKHKLLNCMHTFLFLLPFCLSTWVFLPIAEKYQNLCIMPFRMKYLR